MAGRPSLGVDLAGIALPLPIVAASGCLGDGRDGTGLVDGRRLGAIVTRTLTASPSPGGPTPRLAQTPSGLLTAIGMQNPGVDSFLEEDLPRLRELGPPIIVSIGGRRVEDFLRVCHSLHEAPGVVALEVYLSSPDDERSGTFASRMDRTIEVVGAVSRFTRFPVFAKLPLLGPELVDVAHACVRAGAHGLTLIDGVPGLAIDTATRRPALAATYGLLSGPTLRPIALAAVHRVASAMPTVPLMGVGGIATGNDAAEFLLAGAWAVQVGTAMLVDPDAPVRIGRELAELLRARGLASPADLRGRLREGVAEEEDPDR
ncbi:MAG: dihydroorotate dehydrogenase [Actinomycetota bacterium]